MSKKERNLHREIMNDLKEITPDKTPAEQLAYQVGFLSAHLARIYEHDWILRHEWCDRIELVKAKRNLD